MECKPDEVEYEGACYKTRVVRLPDSRLIRVAEDKLFDKIEHGLNDLNSEESEIDSSIMYYVHPDILNKKEADILKEIIDIDPELVSKAYRIKK